MRLEKTRKIILLDIGLLGDMTCEFLARALNCVLVGVGGTQQYVAAERSLVGMIIYY